MLKKDWRNLAIALGALAIVLALAVAIVLTLEFGPSSAKAETEPAATEEAAVVQNQTQPADPEGDTPEEPAETEKEDVPEHGDEEPQPQVGHPSLYVETGTEGTKTWTLTASSDEVVIVGGFCVNNTCDGVYTATKGPVEIEVEVTDGFGLVIIEEWARNEFCIRIKQAQELGWAHGTVEPHPNWEACED